MKTRTQIIITIVVIIGILFVWWMTIQEKKTLMEPNKRGKDSSEVIYSEDSKP
jgi:hypothetical protein